MWAGGGIEFSRPDRFAAKHRQGGQRGKRTDHCPRQQSWVPVARTMKSVPIGGARCPDCRGNSGSLPAKRCGWPGRQPRPTPLTCRWQRRRTHQGDQDRRDRERIAGVLTATAVNTTMRPKPRDDGNFPAVDGGEAAAHQQIGNPAAADAADDAERKRDRGDDARPWYGHVSLHLQITR
jgi:hypothetical protein